MFSLRTANAGLFVGKTEASAVDLRKKYNLAAGSGPTWLYKNRIVVELKCKDALHPCGRSASLIASSLLNFPIGPLINFHVVLLKDGIRRFVNDYQEHDLLEDERFNRKVRKVIAKRARFFLRFLCTSIAPFAVKSFP